MAVKWQTRGGRASREGIKGHFPAMANPIAMNLLPLRAMPHQLDGRSACPPNSAEPHQH